MKAIILKEEVLAVVAHEGNQGAMLWLLRKKLHTIETFTIEEALSLMSMIGSSGGPAVESARVASAVIA